MKTLFLVLLLGVQRLFFAQEAFVIKDVTVFDGEQLIEKTSVLVEDGYITKVAKRIKGKYKVIKAKDKFLMPALTNCHVHLWSPLQLQEAAQAGVLNLLDMHGAETIQEGLKTLGESEINARLYTAGYAATAAGGHGTQFRFPVPTIEKPEDAPQWVAERVAASADYIKIIVEPWKTTIDYSTAKAVIVEAHKAEKVAVVHVSNEEDAYEVLTSDADGLVHIWRDKVMPEDRFQDLITNRSFFVIPTVLTNVLIQQVRGNKAEEEIQAITNQLQSEVKRLYDAGVPILAGTDPPNANINMGTDLYKELAYFRDAGISAIAVLKSATSLPADKFPIGKVGYIKSGYIADMLLLKKSPIDDITHLNTIEVVWKEGVSIKKSKS